MRKHSVHRRHDLSDRVCNLIAPLQTGQQRQWGGVAKDDRTLVNAVFRIIRTGVPWRDIAPDSGHWNMPVSDGVVGARKVSGQKYLGFWLTDPIDVHSLPGCKTTLLSSEPGVLRAPPQDTRIQGATPETGGAGGFVPGSDASDPLAKYVVDFQSCILIFPSYSR